MIHLLKPLWKEVELCAEEMQPFEPWQPKKDNMVQKLRFFGKLKLYLKYCITISMSLKITIKYSSTQVKIGNLPDSFELQLAENVKFKIFNENIDYIRYAFDKYSV